MFDNGCFLRRQKRFKCPHKEKAKHAVIKAANAEVVQTSLTGALARRLAAVPNMQSTSTESVRATNITRNCWKCESRLYSGQTTCSTSSDCHCIIHQSPVSKFNYRCDTRHMHNFKPTNSFVALVTTDRRSRNCVSGEDASMPFCCASATSNCGSEGARKIGIMSAAVANSVNNSPYTCKGSIAVSQLVCSDSVLQLPYQKLHHHQLGCSRSDFNNSLQLTDSSTVSNWITSSWPVHELPVFTSAAGSLSNGDSRTRSRDISCRTSQIQESEITKSYQTNSCSIGMPTGFRQVDFIC